MSPRGYENAAAAVGGGALTAAGLLSLRNIRRGRRLHSMQERWMQGVTSPTNLRDAAGYYQEYEDQHAARGQRKLSSPSVLVRMGRGAGSKARNLYQAALPQKHVMREFTPAERLALHAGVLSVPATGVYLASTADQRRRPAPARMPAPMHQAPFAKQSSWLARFLNANRAAVSGGARTGDVTRREFLGRMARGAAANSPLGNLDQVDSTLLQQAVRRAATGVGMSQAQLTRRQALRALPVAAAGPASVALDVSRALQPSLAKNMAAGAFQAVNPMKADAMVARATGLSGLRKKVRAAAGAQGLIDAPTQNTMQNLQRVAVGAPKTLATVAQSVLTAA